MTRRKLMIASIAALLLACGVLLAFLGRVDKGDKKDSNTPDKAVSGSLAGLVEEEHIPYNAAALVGEVIENSIKEDSYDRLIELIDEDTLEKYRWKWSEQAARDYYSGMKKAMQADLVFSTSAVEISTDTDSAYRYRVSYSIVWKDAGGIDAESYDLTQENQYAVTVYIRKTDGRITFLPCPEEYIDTYANELGLTNEKR